MKIHSRTMLRDKDGYHRCICLFCGNILKWAQKEKQSDCTCVNSQEFLKMINSGSDNESLQKYVNENTKWYVVFTGKHSETITSNKKEYDALMELKKIRAEDNKAITLKRQEEWRIAREKAAIEATENRKKWEAIEEKCLLNSRQILKNATMEELIDGLITIIDNIKDTRYDDPVVTDYRTYVTYEELKEYIQTHFEELVDNEIARRNYEESWDE